MQLPPIHTWRFFTFISSPLRASLRLKYSQELCTQILERSPYDKAAWFLKARAETEKVYTDEIEMEDEGMAELMLDDNSTAEIPRWEKEKGFFNKIFK